MIDRSHTFTCDICARSEKYDDNVGAHTDTRMPPGWWSLQCTHNYSSMFVKDVCASCWGLLFVELFPKTKPPPPPPPPPPPVPEVPKKGRRRARRP